MKAEQTKHVLFLAYHFPPLGGAGVQRNTKAARDFLLSSATG